MRRDRSDNSGWGGCLMYYKNGLPIVRETHLEPKRHELMIFTIQTSSGILLLSLVYCPPKKARGVIDWYDKHVDNLISKTKSSICVMTGDFNCHHREWLSSQVPHWCWREGCLRILLYSWSLADCRWSYSSVWQPSRTHHHRCPKHDFYDCHWPQHWYVWPLPCSSPARSLPTVWNPTS